MGRDGAASLKLMRDAGARTVGQNEESSVVYGMPRVANEMGAVEHQVTLEKIGPMLLTLAEKKR
jgi:two-component system chemotaxis response regulator CheB